MLPSLLLECFYTGVRLAEELQPADEFLHISRQDGLQGDPDNRGSLINRSTFEIYTELKKRRRTTLFTPPKFIRQA